MKETTPTRSLTNEAPEVIQYSSPMNIKHCSPMVNQKAYCSVRMSKIKDLLAEAKSKYGMSSDNINYTTPNRNHQQ